MIFLKLKKNEVDNDALHSREVSQRDNNQRPLEKGSYTFICPVRPRLNKT